MCPQQKLKHSKLNQQLLLFTLRRRIAAAAALRLLNCRYHALQMSPKIALLAQVQPRHFMHRIPAHVAHERRRLVTRRRTGRRVKQRQIMLMIRPSHRVRPLDAVDVQIIPTLPAVVGEGLAVFQACIACETVAVRRRRQQGERVLEVGLVLDFARRVEAGFVEVEGAVGLRAAVGGAGYRALTSRADFGLAFLDLH